MKVKNMPIPKKCFRFEGTGATRPVFGTDGVIYIDDGGNSNLRYAYNPNQAWVDFNEFGGNAPLGWSVSPWDGAPVWTSLGGVNSAALIPKDILDSPGLQIKHGGASPPIGPYQGDVSPYRSGFWTVDAAGVAKWLVEV